MSTVQRKKRRWLLWVPAVAMLLLIALPVALIGGVGSVPCSPPAAGPGTQPVEGGRWIATAYGPPWDALNGSGITATGLNLTAGQPAYEIAVDPTVIPLRSFEHVQPNPFGTRRAFYAGDTGGAIIGRHVDVYDWKGRAAQDAWGLRHVAVTPAPNPGTGNLLGEITPGPQLSTAGGVGGRWRGSTGWAPACNHLAGTAPLKLTSAQQAQILPDGSAAAPQDAPAPVKLAIAAANQIHTTYYRAQRPEQLNTTYPWYDCSASTDYVLYHAGLNGPGVTAGGANAGNSTLLEAYGKPGPGKWITVYANSGHAWIVIAGRAFDTANYGGPNIPAGTGPRWRSDPTGNLADQLSYVVRHPAGL